MHIQVEKRSASLAQKLFRADQVSQREEQAAELSMTTLYGLMQRAGKAVYEGCFELVPNCEHFLFVVGSGNNAGDGYVAATLALDDEHDVKVAAVNPDKPLTGDALKAQEAFLAAGGKIVQFNDALLSRADIIVDALFGTGVQGLIRQESLAVINAINEVKVPVLSVDVPSGLNATTGVAFCGCVQADMTVTFIGIKQGLVIAAGKEASGVLKFADLDVGKAFAEVCPSNTHLLNLEQFEKLAPRRVNSHKGRFGRLLCIGGNAGMSGAIRLAGEAALRAGTGLVKIYAHPDCRVQISAGRPELMVISDALEDALEWANTIVIGPGLGQDEWAQETFKQVIDYLQKKDLPIVLDADALNMLPQHATRFSPSDCILTPHTGEAARLLETTLEDVDSSRYSNAKLLSQRYGVVTVLKGPGTIVDNAQRTWVSEHGNPGMATAGMGDVLSGILGALMAQRMSNVDAAKYGVCVHGRAADIIAQEYGERGMLASDIFPEVRRLINT